MNIDKIEGYLVDCEIRGLSMNTIKVKKSMLNDFLKFLNEGNYDPNTNQEWLDYFKEYLYFKKNNGCSRGYIQQIVISQRQYNKYNNETWLNEFPIPKKENLYLEQLMIKNIKRCCRLLKTVHSLKVMI